MTGGSARRLADGVGAVRAKSAARSHVGLVRAINEDRIFESSEAQVWAVADGMGGHAGGDLAAQAVVDQLRSLIGTGGRPAFADVLAALHHANDDILRRNRLLGLEAGTTVAAVCIEGDTVNVAWAGDSRAYLLRGRTLDLLTTDHSVVQELVDAGLLTLAQAERHPNAHVVTRALGVAPDPGLQIVSRPLEPGDRLLLCTDGLSRSMVEADMDDCSIYGLADRLIANALLRDGTDNASLIVLELTVPND